MSSTLRIFSESIGPGSKCEGCKRAKRKWRNGVAITKETDQHGNEACSFCDVPQSMWAEHLKSQLLGN